MPRMTLPSEAEHLLLEYSARAAIISELAQPGAGPVGTVGIGVGVPEGVRKGVGVADGMDIGLGVVGMHRW